MGLKRTSLKSSLRSESTRGILDAQKSDDQDEADKCAVETPLRKAAAAVVVAGPKPQPPNPNLQMASVFIAKRGPAQPQPPWLYLGLESLSLCLSVPPSPFLPPLLLGSRSLSTQLQQSGRRSSGQAGRHARLSQLLTHVYKLLHTHTWWHCSGLCAAVLKSTPAVRLGHCSLSFGLIGQSEGDRSKKRERYGHVQTLI